MDRRIGILCMGVVFGVLSGCGDNQAAQPVAKPRIVNSHSQTINPTDFKLNAKFAAEGRVVNGALLQYKAILSNTETPFQVDPATRHVSLIKPITIEAAFDNKQSVIVYQFPGETSKLLQEHKIFYRWIIEYSVTETGEIKQALSPVYMTGVGKGDESVDDPIVGTRG